MDERKEVASRDVLLQTETMDEAASFYEGELGLAVTRRWPDLIELEAGGFRLYLDRGSSLGPVFEIFVEDVPAAKARLLARGCKVEAEDPSVPKYYLRDPYGLIFNIALRR